MAAKGRQVRGRTKDGNPVVGTRLRGRMAALVAGEISIEDMDDEELARGQFKDKNGKFTGRPNQLMPREIHVKMKQELLRRGNDLFQTGYFNAIQVFLDIAMDEEQDAQVRLKAAQYVIERTGGKTPDKLEISGDAPWQIMLNKIVLETSDGTVDVVDGAAISRRANGEGVPEHQQGSAAVDG